MDLLEFIKNRKTTYQFSDKKISKNDLDKILEAARWAPSSKNTQPWHFIVVRDKKMIAKLIAECYYNLFHTSPDVIVAVVMDWKIKNEKLKEIEQSLGYLNIAMPVINMGYEAQSLGIGSCILTPLENVGPMLEVPKSLKVPVLLGLGYEKEVIPIKRTRKNLGEIVSYGTFKG